MELNCVTYANPKYIIIVKVWILTCAYYDNNIVPLLSRYTGSVFWYYNIDIPTTGAAAEKSVKNARRSSLLQKTDGWAVPRVHFINNNIVYIYIYETRVGYNN